MKGPQCAYNAGMIALLLLALDDLDAKIAKVLPTPEEEIWLAIPWRTDLWAARKDAQDASKPLFMWMMNGHPMGCT